MRAASEGGYGADFLSCHPHAVKLLSCAPAAEPSKGPGVRAASDGSGAALTRRRGVDPGAVGGLLPVWWLGQNGHMAAARQV